MADEQKPVPAEHSLRNIGQDLQRTIIGVGIIGLATLAALKYITPADAGMAISLIVGSHYIMT